MFSSILNVHSCARKNPFIINTYFNSGEENRHYFVCFFPIWCVYWNSWSLLNVLSMNLQSPKKKRQSAIVILSLEFFFVSVACYAFIEMGRQSKDNSAFQLMPMCIKKPLLLLCPLALAAIDCHYLTAAVLYSCCCVKSKLLPSAHAQCLSLPDVKASVQYHAPAPPPHVMWDHFLHTLPNSMCLSRSSWVWHGVPPSTS